MGIQEDRSLPGNGDLRRKGKRGEGEGGKKSQTPKRIDLLIVERKSRKKGEDQDTGEAI